MGIIDMRSQMGNVGLKLLKEGGANQSRQMRAGDGPQISPENIPVLGGFNGLGPFGDTVWNHLLYDTSTTELPPWGTRERDIMLRAILADSSALLGSIVYNEVVRIQNMKWGLRAEEEDFPEDEMKQWRKILKRAQFGEGFSEFAALWTTDYLSQNNGAFIEIIIKNGKGKERQERKETDEIIGIAVLDSALCYRTPAPEYPVVYRNPFTGEMTAYHRSKVLSRSQFSQNYEQMWGIGICAVDRAYSSAMLMREAHVYMYEKISGSEPDIAFVSGIGKRSLDGALSSAKAEAQNNGQTRYKGVVFLAAPSIGPSFPKVDVNLVSLKSTPDGWSHGDEVDIAINKASLAFGFDRREIWSGSSSGATKAESEAQHRKASAKGRIDAIRSMEYLINEYILPDGLIFEFLDKDLQEEKADEQARTSRANRLMIYKNANAITAEEFRATLVEHGDIAPVINAPHLTDDEAVIPVTPEIEEPEPAIPQQLMPPDEIDRDKDVDDNDEPRDSTGMKAIGDTRLSFKNQLTQMLSDLRDADWFTLTEALDTLIDEMGPLAFMDGLASAGVDISDGLPLDLSGVLTRILNDLKGFVGGFAFDMLDDPSTAQIENRTDLWLNKGIDELYVLGQLNANPAARFKWILGATDHCNTCLTASGQIHSAESLMATGIYPRSNNLDCGGFRCQCELELTDEPMDGDLTNVPNRGLLGFLSRIGPFNRILQMLRRQ